MSSFKKNTPTVGFMCFNLSPSVSWRLVFPWVLLTVGERRLLVACGAAAAGVLSRRVRGGVVVGWISVLLVELADTLAIPSIRKEGQDSLRKEVGVNKWSFLSIFL